MTEAEAVYQQNYHGHFSQKLAKWAIDMMEAKDPATGKKKKVSMRPVEEVLNILGSNEINVPEKNVYDAWYLYHMTIADYLKSLPNDRQRSLYVEETICDPDGTDGDVLACFEAKMCKAGIPIHWDRYI